MGIIKIGCFDKLYIVYTNRQLSYNKSKTHENSIFDDKKVGYDNLYIVHRNRHF